MRPCNAHDGERCHLLVSSMCRRQLLQPFAGAENNRMSVYIPAHAYTPNGCPSASRRGGEGQRGLEAELHALQTASAQQCYIYPCSAPRMPAR